MTKKSSVHHFPVGNGDMTLLKIASDDKFFTVLVDMYIRQNGQSDNDKCDVLSELHELLLKDDHDRPYVDVLILTHPDEDHILGFEKHFHTGAPADYVKPGKDERGKVFIREIWSSPMVFRRKSKNHSLCQDARAFNKEAKRRVKLFREKKLIADEGNRIRLIGQDCDGKTDDILSIVYDRGDTITKLNETHIKELNAKVLAPLADSDFPENSSPDKNRSSIVMQWCIASHGFQTPSNYILLGGDAGVEAWEVLWDKYKSDKSKLQYDILLAPHHCSWHTLSHDSFSKSDNPKASKKALSALGEARSGATIVSSSNKIKNDKTDPPNYQAMKEYKSIVNSVNGSFKCLADNKSSSQGAPEVMTFRLTNSGPQLDTTPKSGHRKGKATAVVSAVASGEAIGHG